MGTNRKYWKGLEELNKTPEFVASTKSEFPQELSVDQFLAEDKLKESSTGRRDFLKFLGFSVAAATVAACESPVINAVPYAVKPEDITPGVANWYASSYYDGDSYASILVKTREGRPIHIKGNKEQGITKGGTNPRIVGSVLSLYNGARLQNPQMDGGEATWGDADGAIMKHLQATADKGKKIVLLSNTVISPSTGSIIAEFKAKFNGTGNAEELIENAGAEPAVAAVAEGGTPEEQMLSAEVDGVVQHVQYDAISYNGMREANLESFGKRVIPDYDFSKAKTIVSVGADFMNSWVLPTQFLTDYVSRRNPDGKWMSRHFQFEANMSMTGSNADVRSMIKPSEESKVLALLYKGVSGKSISGIDTSSLNESVTAKVQKAAEELKASKGKSIVVAGSNRKSIQVIVNAINSALNNYSSTINLNDPINLYQSEDAKMASFIKDMNAGKVGAVVMWDTNPVYTLGAQAEAFKTGLAKVGLTVSMSQYADETATLCKYICPASHPLESWNDFNPKKSHYSLAQPTIRPLHNTRPAAESLLVWAGKAQHDGKDSKTYYEYLRGTWEKYGFPYQSEYLDFHSYWSAMVHNSCGNVEVTPASAMAFNGNLSAAGKAEGKISGGEWELTVYQKSGIGSGQHANNPWLQELPDPVSKVTWDNYVTMSPKDMEAKGYSMVLGQEQSQNVVKVTVNEASIELPVYPQPGQTPGTIGIAVGYGRGENGENIGKSAYQQEGIYGQASKEMIGRNAFKLVSGQNEAFSASIEDTGSKYILACTQTHATVMARNSILKETTLDIYKANGDDSSAYNHRHTLHTGWDHEVKPTEEFDLWESHPVEEVGHRWGMSIDLNLCIGCGSCVVACGSENNVPVVGRDEVRRGREMHWLRIDRYYASDVEATVGTRDPEKFDAEGFAGLEDPADNPKVAYMPLMCHHCNHAPCETVCPVAATTHSNEGLNMMAYNRCIGTRYCGNNCPYKVRRFNWFNYPSYRKFTEVNPAQDDLGRMVLNPDVVVRTRGVMEKCSFCVQKIQSGKLVAKKADRPVLDGEVTSACADVCPSGAITFGDWNDTESKIRKVTEDKRSYQALEEIGVKPNVWYQVKVRNEENAELAEIQTAHGHGGDHGDHGGDHGDGDGHDNGGGHGDGGNHDQDTGHGDGSHGNAH